MKASVNFSKTMRSQSLHARRRYHVLSRGTGTKHEGTGTDTTNGQFRPRDRAAGSALSFDCNRIARLLGERQNVRRDCIARGWRRIY